MFEQHYQQWLEIVGDDLLKKLFKRIEVECFFDIQQDECVWWKSESARANILNYQALLLNKHLKIDPYLLELDELTGIGLTKQHLWKAYSGNNKRKIFIVLLMASMHEKNDAPATKWSGYPLEINSKLFCLYRRF
nr:hypothetical protein [Methylomarinum sp. Ch1-1]MDP4518974.1 hypothetical protein [Methylomarinum sp. Ch1-1]MDP4523372.1 hypothetical protein [Methylomarinum sp. Ch1-1]